MPTTMLPLLWLAFTAPPSVLAPLPLPVLPPEVAQRLVAPPHQYVLARRMSRARELLRCTALPLGEIALACGFASASHFTNRFRQVLGGTPGEYRQAFLR